MIMLPRLPLRLPISALLSVAVLAAPLTASAAEPFEINAILPVTGAGAFGQDAERAIDAAFGEKGPYRTSIVAREHFNPTDLSVSAQMTRIKASRAQALVAWSTGTPAATLLRGVVDVGLNLLVIATSVGAWPGTRR
jgi:branched-chain amino acid transport system substrate-binding protein